jgi:hypothetical protein
MATEYEMTLYYENRRALKELKRVLSLLDTVTPIK